MRFLFVHLVLLAPAGPRAVRGRAQAAYGKSPAGKEREPELGETDPVDAEDDWSWWEFVGEAAITIAFVVMLLFCLLTRRPPSVRICQSAPLKRKAVRSHRRR